jgi:hypothetical protein
MLPNLVVVCTTIALLCVVRKASGRITKQSTVTSILVGIVYLFSYLPVSFYGAVYDIILSTDVVLTPEKEHLFNVIYYKFSYFVIYVNGIANFFVYYVSINSFHIFVKRAAHFYFQRLTRSCQVGLPEAFEMQNFRR